MSQPALSGAIAALEESLDTQLVERTTRRVLAAMDDRNAVAGAGLPVRLVV